LSLTLEAEGDLALNHVEAEHDAAGLGMVLIPLKDGHEVGHLGDAVVGEEAGEEKVGVGKVELFGVAVLQLKRG
jgi:hypothetical protein